MESETMPKSFSLLMVIMGAASVGFAEEAKPQSTDPNVVIELFAEHPTLVTPTGLAVDKTGRVFVAESHTHFRPDNYEGPKADRIVILEDRNHDGIAETKTIFHEGFTHIMDLAFHDDGSLFVATRKDIHRMWDINGDGKADEVKRVINLETKGNYPHNGISGLAFHQNGRLSFGLGENLGADYTISGTNDKTRYTGGGEGGSTYQVDADGKNLRRVSTGWWNPFGMCVDAFDRVFGTDNDPGASPPCRLIQVIEGGDYGYEYRYGRTGLHPLISWTGSNPGNLPMISGTGEAPCAVMAYESDALPEKYLGRLLVASWADHRIEHYNIIQPKNQGLTTTKREVLIEGHNEFRPVDLALAPDGSVYVTDWVSSSYTLHKKGRVWRIRPKNFTPKPRPQDPAKAVLSLHRPLREKAARELIAKYKPTDDPLSLLLFKYKNPRVRSALIQAWAANRKLKLDSLDHWLFREQDVRLQQLGVRLLGERGLKVDFNKWNRKPPISVKATAMIAGSAEVNQDTFFLWFNNRDPLLHHAQITGWAREYRQGKDPVIPSFHGPGMDDLLTTAMLALMRSGKKLEADSDPDTIFLHEYSDSDFAFVIIKWIADEKLKEYRPDLVKLLDSHKLSYRNFRAVAAAIDRLDGKKPNDHPAPEFLLELITKKNPPANLLRLSLREIDPTFKKLKVEHLAKLVTHEDPQVSLEAVRTLANHPDAKRFDHLIQIANHEKQPQENRAAAITGMAEGLPETETALMAFATGKAGVLRDEAARSLAGVKPELRGEIPSRPDVNNLSAWRELLQLKADGMSSGDPQVGERIFFGSKVGTCARCHQIDGRGTAVGPDLTQIARRLDSQDQSRSEWLLKTILRPSEDMAPQYTPWIILTTQGKTLTGLPRRKGGNSEAYLGIDGKEFSVKKQDIESHKESRTSIMPKDLLQNLTDQEIRDLFAFLMQDR